MSDRTVVVTGGNKGIGRAIVEQFAAAGDRVIAVGRDAGAVSDVAGEPGVEGEICDVTDESAVGEMFGRIGEVDVLVTNAGVALSAPVAKMTMADWDVQHAVNATGTFLCVRAALPGMVARGIGRIVSVSSVAGVGGARYISGYAASKHATVGLIRSVAAEVAGSGVTANAVCPAYVRTEMTQRAVDGIVARTGRTIAEGEAMLAGMSMLGRLLEPGEVAFAVAFLAAPEAAAINGQTLILDGGGVNA